MAEKIAVREYLKAQEREQKARDLSTQAALDEKFARRENLANKPVGGYTEKEENTRRFWENFLNNDSFYSPHQDLLESRQRRDAAQHRTEMAEDASTQAALDEKNAMRRALDSNNAVTYNKHTGEYTIAVDKLPDTGKWNVTTADGKVVVDPKVEQRIARASRLMSAILTSGPNSLNPLDDVLSPVLENLINAGLLRYMYGTDEYVLNNPNTKEVGIYFTEVMGKGGLINVGLIADKYGNVGITFTLGASAGTPNMSAGGYVSGTNASKIYDTEGVGFGIGGSVGIKGVGAGLEYNVLVDAEAGKIYTGQTASFGASLGSVMVPVEGHASVTWTEVFGFNVLQTLETLRRAKR